MASIKATTGALKQTRFSHFGDVHSQLKRHEAKDGEDDKTGKEAGQTIEYGHKYSVPVMADDWNVSSLTCRTVQNWKTEEQKECFYL